MANAPQEEVEGKLNFDSKISFLNSHVYAMIDELKKVTVKPEMEEELNKHDCCYGRLKFKLKPGLGDKGFFDTKAFTEEGGPPVKAEYSKDGYVSFLSPIEGLKSKANEAIKQVFADKKVE